MCGTWRDNNLGRSRNNLGRSRLGRSRLGRSRGLARHEGSALRESIMLRGQQLRIFWLGLQRIIAGSHIRKLRAPQLIALKLRAFGGLGQPLDVCLLRHQAAHVAKFRGQLAVTRVSPLCGFEYAYGFLVASLVNQGICEPHPWLQLIRVARQCRCRARNPLGLLACLAGCSCQRPRVTIGLGGRRLNRDVDEHCGKPQGNRRTSAHDFTYSPRYCRRGPTCRTPTCHWADGRG